MYVHKAIGWILFCSERIKAISDIFAAEKHVLELLALLGDNIQEIQLESESQDGEQLIVNFCRATSMPARNNSSLIVIEIGEKIWLS